MKVKKFMGNTVNEAVDKVKHEFGNDAVILHTKKIRQGGIFGLFGKTKIEVIGAFDPNIETANNNAKTSYEKSVAQKPVYSSDQSKQKIDDSKWPDTVQQLFQELTVTDISRDTAKELIKNVLSTVPKNEWNNLSKLREQLRNYIMRQITTVEPWDFTNSQQVIALIGPTGVGKTTTVAKLAANFALVANKKVGLITIDTYRMAAVEQLKIYADIIGVSIYVAYNLLELKEYLNQMTEYDLVLIDTAGRSHLNNQQMKELTGILSCIQAETHLVLSATTKQTDLAKIIEQFSELDVNRLIISKIDETSSYGTILQAAITSKAPISFITNGQSVPEDIEIADPKTITSLILGEYQ